MSSTEPSTIRRYANDPYAANQPDTGFRVEQDAVYLILWDQNLPDKFHWAILVSLTDSFGLIYHQTLSGTEWKLVYETRNVARSRTVLAAIKIGEIKGDIHEWIRQSKQCGRQTTVTNPAELTCRTWVMAAVDDLDKAGLLDLSLDPMKLADLEEEAKFHAVETRQTRLRRVITSVQFKGV
ncbi:hypothetical protein FQN57_004994 [Myotisia sp. PD_48]|nr:hypothetical protein FQN57_004994 [Myotisia sp. PD_48]